MRAIYRLLPSWNPLSFGFPIAHWFGAEKPATTNEQNHANESFHKWLLSSVRPHPDVRFSKTVWKHLGCQRSEQEPADGDRIADALSRSNSPRIRFAPGLSKLQISGKGEISVAGPCSSSQNLRVKMTP